ncbi:KdsC family phosphatase [Nitrosophilus alvini]|uniref:KdsC family phosphatase n=1 Tax=Nitrosophilus alvini TaxID=2714855 RepID=UPI00190A40BF|nr:HAD-IIIA family hydrolase [Nitrosophilus alvini]
MIELIVLDVDGCMTNGKIIYTNSGDEIKSFNVKDGFAIKAWMRLGKKVAIITGRNSEIVERRAKELGVHYLYQGSSNKLEALDEIRKKSHLEFSQIAVIGDDLNDYKMLKNAGISFIPKDASPYLHQVADVILSKKGGDGAVREMIEYLIKKEGLEAEFLKEWIE